jgi:hypothetical protein
MHYTQGKQQIIAKNPIHAKKLCLRACVSVCIIHIQSVFLVIHKIKTYTNIHFLLALLHL